jgi:hypothetical protein
MFQMQTKLKTKTLKSTQNVDINRPQMKTKLKTKKKAWNKHLSKKTRLILAKDEESTWNSRSGSKSDSCKSEKSTQHIDTVFQLQTIPN